MILIIYIVFGLLYILDTLNKIQNTSLLSSVYRAALFTVLSFSYVCVSEVFV